MTFRLGIVAILASGALGAAPQSNGARAAASPDLKEIRDYRLSMDNIQRFAAAYQSMAKDDAVAKCFKDKPPGNAPTLDAGQKLVEACPAAVAALQAKGLKPREFLVITAGLIGDFMAVGMKKQGQIKEYPPSISPENAAFLEQNFDKLKASLESLMGPAGK